MAKTFPIQNTILRSLPPLDVKEGNTLVAPYCAIPRDYLSDTPLLRAMGLLVSQHGQLGAIPPPLFLSVSALERACKVEVRYPPPPSKGVPSAQKSLPTGIFILGNYLEIGNVLPYRKNSFQELFGPVIVIKLVMENLAGKVLFLVCARDKLSGIISLKLGARN